MKDFDTWNHKKKNIDKKISAVDFKIRDIWFMYAGLNIGFEEDGVGTEFLRPILILKKFNRRLFWGVFLSTKVKKGKYYYEIDSSVTGKKTVAILSQVKLVDAKRLHNKRAVLSKNQFQEIIKRLQDLLGGAL
jgi:mRNA interferase MazF